ncbi:MAG TPA: N-acetyltransferase [Armatimonadota bacterium]|jgi:putative acetyltransferase
MIIRDETPGDIAAITEVTIAAFTGHPYSHNTEQFIVVALRAAQALTVSLVAEIDGRVVGHIAFSPATIAGRACGWYGLGPISVVPERQRQGIGTALIQEGLQRLRALGAQGCVLVGDPNYYARFGFRNLPQLTLDGVPPANFMALPLGDATAHGAVGFHAGFHAQC